MQTIDKSNQKQIIDCQLLDLLRKPVEEFDLHGIKNAVTYLRSTVVSEISQSIGTLGSDAIDVAGTGGSGVVKFNTSTAIAFILAAHGVKVIKFGNRSITGNSGSMDFLAAIGCLKDVNPNDFERVLKSTNLIFLSAPMCYPGLAKIRNERKKIGKPTIFNFIGPLLNPAQPAFRLFGISNSYMHLLINQFLKTEPLLKRAITVHSTIRTITASVTELDEFLPSASNTATLIERQSCAPSPARLTNLDVALPEKSLLHDVVTAPDPPQGSIIKIEAVKTSHAELNAKLFQKIVDGDDCQSIHFQGIVLNAGAAFLAANAVGDLNEGIELSKKLIASGSVARKLEQVRRILA